MEQPGKIPGGAGARDVVTTLDRILPPGSCRVASVLATGPVRKRLLALGFVPGAVVEAVRAAPLGDPVEYRVKGYLLSLRKEEARFITVAPGGCVTVEAVPLSFLPPGTESTVAAIRAGHGLVRHLASMGILPGSRITVICADRGSLIVSAAGTRYALSKGMAMKILVGQPGVKSQ